MYRRHLLTAAAAAAFGSAACAPALAREPLIKLGPKAPPVGSAIEYSSGDDLSSGAASLIAQNEKGAAQGVRQVVIPFFQVEFVTRSAAVSNGSGLNSARVSYVLTGPSEEMFQSITNAFYAQYLSDLKAAGVTVIPLEEATAKSPGLVRLMNLAKPTPYQHGSAVKSTFYSPPGMKFYFTPNDNRGKALSDTMATIGSQVPEEMAMNELNAGIMGVRMVVDFAEIQAAGRGFRGMRPTVARVKSRANVSLVPADSQMWLMTPKAKSTYMDPAHRLRYTLVSPILLPDSVISASDVTTRGTKVSDAMVGAIGILGGTGMSTKTTDYEVRVDPDLWSRDVSGAMTQVSRCMITRLKADL